MKALGHPVRFAIVEHLSLRGPLTASQLAEVLDQTPANCSWHLRKLAGFGLVEETGEGVGRRRPWRMRRIGFTWPKELVDSDPAFARAASGLDRQIIQRHVDRFLATSADPRWARVGLSETTAFMTEEEATAYADDVRELIFRYHDRLVDPVTRPSDARAVHVLVLTQVDPA